MKTKNILLYSILGGLFASLFIPFIVGGNMYFPFIAGKGFAFRIITEIVFALYVILAVMYEEYRPKLSWITKAVGLFVLVTFIADLFSANVYKSLWSNYERMEGFVLIAHLGLFYLVSSSVLITKQRWHQFINVSIVASIIMSIYALFQIMGKLTINQGGIRVDGTFGNASYLAIYLVFNIFLCLYMFLQPTTGDMKWKKWFYGLSGLLQIYVLYFTATRGAILGFIGGLLLTSILIAWKEKENKVLRKYAYGVLIGVVVLVGGFMLVRNVDFVRNNQVLSRFSTLSFSEVKTQGRYYVWPMAVKGILERPVFGWGQESFNFVFNKYYNPQMYAQEQWFDRTHNVVLDWMINGGLLGFLSYASMYVALLYLIWKKNNHLNIAEKSLFTGLIGAYVFHNLFVFDNIGSYIMFFSILAFIHSLSVLDKEGHGKFYTQKFSNNTKNYVVPTGVAVVFLFVLYFVNVPAIEANYTLIKAMTPQQQGGVEENLALFKKTFSYNSFGSSEALEQLTQIATQLAASQVPESVKKEFYDFTKQKIEEKIKQTPNDARYLVFAGNFFNRFNQYDEAIKYLEKAIVESPKKQPIYFELGTAYLGKGDKQKMFEIFKKAYDLEPNSPESQIIYAVGAIYTKNTEILKEMSPKISPDTIVNDNRFLRAFADIGDYQTVIGILTTRLDKDPKNAQYKLSLASAYATIGQKAKAISLINEIIKDNPDFKTQGEEYIKQIQNG
jgi:O-antigen ligase/tetratricopeptide (TPR) repeat protein